MQWTDMWKFSAHLQDKSFSFRMQQEVWGLVTLSSFWGLEEAW